jgi:hypothetical protein
MGYRVYGEDDNAPLRISEFCIWFFIGCVGFPSQIGWVFVSFGFISNTALLFLSVLMGTVAGIYFSAKEKSLKK